MAALHWSGPARIIDAHVAEPPAGDLGGIEQRRDHVRADLVGTADEALQRIVGRSAQQALSYYLARGCGIQQKPIRANPIGDVLEALFAKTAKPTSTLWTA
ncbi:hypothetical protein X742_33610 [Mesorhizobium sp. LNHC232B00]|nr:hypothetical protein X742_33610 [Mesorhizobium sp. LNHC232B00]